MEFTKKTGVKFGLIAAAIYALGLVIVYLAGVDTFTSWPKTMPWFIMLVVAFIACATELKANGGILSFARAMVIILTVMAIAEASASISEWILYQADSELPTKVKGVKVARTEASFEQFDDLIDYAKGDREEIMKEVENANYNFTVGNAVLKFVVWIVIDFLFALLLAAIVRKEPKTT